jgi:hypothetical protein
MKGTKKARRAALDRAALGRAILALVAGLERPVSMGEIKEMLATQDFNERDVHTRVQAMIVTGKLKLGAGLKIELEKPAWPAERIRADVQWAVAEIGRADRQIAEALLRRQKAIATLIEMTTRHMQ